MNTVSLMLHLPAKLACWNLLAPSWRTGVFGWMLIGMLCLTPRSGLAQSSPLELPPGFQAQLFASNEQATDIQFLTTNAAGQILVSGPGYLHLLLDEDGDGVAETVRVFAEGPKSGAQGLWVDGPDYYCIGDGGILRYRDADGDGQADGPPELMKTFRTGGEHFTHSLRKGPDGDWYLIAGNEAGINASQITVNQSPITSPQAGVLCRLSPDFTSLEVLADGYRNAYDFDFNAQGDLFTYDSDGEREISLPIYLPTRVFHTIPGLNHGWVTRSWKKPNHFAEMSPVLAELGRGSPTGVVNYQHRQFPPEFQNTLFVLDWTYGRIVAVKMKRQGSSWVAQAKNFAVGRGDFGFAPTAACVGPDGAMYVSVGGRGTQGGVYRITYQGDAGTNVADPETRGVSVMSAARARQEKKDRVLRAPQPLAAWSRAKWEPLARSLGEEAFLIAGLDSTRPAAERMRAIEVLVDLYQGPDFDFMRQILAESDRELRARAVWAYGRSVAGQPDLLILQQALEDSSPVVLRAGLEVALGCSDTALIGLEPQIAAVLGHEDRFVKQLAVRVASRMNNDSFREVGEITRKQGWPEAMQMARSFVDRGYLGHPYAWHDIGLEALKRHDSAEHQLTAILLIQHALGGFGDSPAHPAMFDGYLARLPLPDEPEKLQALARQLAHLLSTGDAIVDWELVRLAAMISQPEPELLAKLLTKITPDSPSVHDIHHLTAIACLPVERSAPQREQIAQALLNLCTKQEREKAPVDRNWEPRIAEMYAQLSAFDPELPTALVSRPEFGKVEHVLFVKPMEGAARQQALLRLLQLVQEDQLELTPGILELFAGMQSPQSLRIARESLEDEILEPAAVLLLAEANEPEDRAVLIAGLRSPHWDVVGACLQAQSRWETPSLETLAALLQLSRRLAQETGLDRLWNKTQAALTEQARLWASQQELTPLPDAVLPQENAEAAVRAARQAQSQAWAEWAAANIPDLPTVETGPGADASTLQEWKELFAQVDWSQGEAARGEQVYVARQCAQCHQGRSAIGPNLDGVATRFSQQDLMLAIVDPHRDVSPRYRTTLISTYAGKTYTGIIIYESVDGLLLRDSTHRTIRIEAEDIEFRKVTTQSLMPENLLKDATPTQIADLFAYLKTLGAPATPAPDTSSVPDSIPEFAP